MNVEHSIDDLLEVMCSYTGCVGESVVTCRVERGLRFGLPHGLCGSHVWPHLGSLLDEMVVLFETQIGPFLLRAGDEKVLFCAECRAEEVVADAPGGQSLCGPCAEKVGIL